MSFDLHVTVTGLCALVPDENAQALHVLMPTTHGSSPPDVPLHVPTLSFLPLFLSPVPVTLGVPADVPPPFILEVATLDFDLRRHFVDLSGVGGSGTTVAIPPDVPVAQLSEVTSQEILPQQVGPNPDPSVGARVTLPPFAGPPEYLPGAKWNWGPVNDVELTYNVTFRIPGVPGDHLRWAMTGFGGAPDVAGPDLYPHAIPNLGGNVILLTVQHLPLDPVDVGSPPLSMPDDHFAAYYTLLTPPPAAPVPLYESGGIGSLFTCLLSTVGLQGG